MRILLIAQYYFPNPKSSGKQVHDLAVQFHKLGHEVIVCTPEPSASAPLEVSIEDGVTVCRVRAGRIQNVGKWRRAINEIRLSTVLWRAASDFFLRNPCQLIIFYSPTIFFHALVGKLKKLYGCPAYLILRDIFPQWALDAGILRRGLIYEYFRRNELEQYRQADVIGVQSPANLEYFRANKVGTQKRIEVLYNWGSPPDSPIRNLGFRKTWGLDGKTVFFYGGNIGIAQDIDNVLRLAEKLRNDSRIYFLLVGEGSEVVRLRGQIASKGLSNISIKDSVNQEEYLCMVGEFDVGLISLDRCLKTHNFPGKLSSYLFRGIPVLASINEGNDLRKVLEDSFAGFVSVNGDDLSFESAAIKLANDAKLRQEMGANGKRLMETMFSVAGAAEQILSKFPNKRPLRIERRNVGSDCRNSTK